MIHHNKRYVPYVGQAYFEICGKIACNIRKVIRKIDHLFPILLKVAIYKFGIIGKLNCLLDNAKISHLSKTDIMVPFVVTRYIYLIQEFVM